MAKKTASIATNALAAVCIACMIMGTIWIRTEWLAYVVRDKAFDPMSLSPYAVSILTGWAAYLIATKYKL